MDNELFELCKEVHKKTGWGYEPDRKTPDLLSWRHSPITDEYFTVSEAVASICPAYDSDYLISKLPNKIMGKLLEIYGLDEETGTYFVRYDVMDLVPSNQGWYGARADTPLKALLKLTIALHEARELQPARGDMQ